MKNLKSCRTLYTLCFFICLLLSASGFARTRLSLNEGWSFHLGDVIPEDTGGRVIQGYHQKYDASDWRTLNLPHDWAIEQERDPNHSGLNSFFPGGIAWYRKDFVLPQSDAGKHIELQFDGIYRDATVWVNGYLLGTQYDGYTSFYHDISEVVIPGKTNTIAVRVDCSGAPISRWYSGSGIYRNVWLTKTASLHIKNWGTFITTPEVLRSAATVRIETEIENFSKKTEFVLELDILDPTGNKVASENRKLSAVPMTPLNTAMELTVNKPMLWSLSDPQLYTAMTRVKVNGETLDETSSTFGIRTFEFDTDKGFFLNGQSLKMKGVCLHHAAGSLGAAVPVEVWQRRLPKLKDMGCNAIRTAHNPMSPEFMDLCDRMGFLVLDEFVDKWSYWGAIFNPMFRNEWERNFRETIRRDRNHPSVVIWSVGNENHPAGTANQAQGLREYCSFVRSLDSTRPVVSGMERGLDMPVDQKVKDILDSCSYMDLIAMNYGEQWCRNIHEANPGKPFVSTESYRYFNSAPEKRHALIERNPWLDVLENESNMGMFIWVGINYLGEVGGRGGFPRNGSGSGLLDMSGMRQEESYLHEAFWSETPMVRIAAYGKDIGDFNNMSSWSSPSIKSQWKAQDGAEIDLVTYTNCESVELSLNGKSIGEQKLSDNPNWIINWPDLAYETGVLKAVGKIDGKVVCEYELRTPEPAALIEMLPETKTITPGELIHVEVFLKDKNGTLLVDDKRTLRFEIEGGEILALENGDIMYAGDFQDRDTRPFHNGSVVCIIQVQSNAVTLSATADGVPMGTMSLRAN